MGNFFTLTQIYNPNRFDRDQFINFFCEEMKKSGYAFSNSDESEVSYILRFANGCKWVTITSEAYEQGNQLSRSDAGKIAKILRTVCINTTVIDSDCAMLDLYDKSGKKKDSLVMGRADDYFGDDIPEPIESVWNLLLEDGYSWKQLLDVRNGDYVFVEEGLAEIAPIIGLDREGILLAADNFSGDKRAVELYFKKNAAKKEKKLTPNAAFDMVFGETLKPLGFKKPKLRQQYYIRLINDEILHIIGIRDMKTHLSVFGGIATVYRETLCLDRPFRQNENWLKSAMHFYVKWRVSNRPLDSQIQSGFQYQKEIDPQSIIEATKHALDAAVTWILPVLDQVKTLEAVVGYQMNTIGGSISIPSLPLNESHIAPYNDAAIWFLLKDPLLDLENRCKESIANFDREATLYHHTAQMIAETHMHYHEMLEESKEILRSFNEDQRLHQQTIEELAQRKSFNILLLKKYGI